MEVRKGYIILGSLAILVIWGVSGYLIYINFDANGRGSIGDMFGAVNALFSGFALFGIIVSILIQQNELNLQRKELADTREEFKTNRITNILFKQVEYLNDSIDKIKFKDERTLNIYTLYELNNKLEKFKTNMNNNPSYFSVLKKNSDSLIYMTTKIFPIIKNFEKLLTKSNLNEEEIQSLKELFSSNINHSLFDLYILYFKDWIDIKYKEIDRMGDKEIKALEYGFLNITKDKIDYILSYNVMDE